MTRRKVLGVERATCAIVLSLLTISCVGCHRHQDPLVVNLVMPGNGTAFRVVSDRISSFSSAKPITASGRPIVVQGVYPRADQFTKFVEQVRPLDIIVCDSPQQLAAIPELEQDVERARNVCGQNANCPALIAPWVPPDKQEAVQRVFRAISGGSTY